VARRYDFYFREANNILRTSAASKIFFWNEKIKCISSSRRVMFFLLYRQKEIDEIKYKFRREITEITSSINLRVTLRKINYSGPRCSFYEVYESYIFQ